MTLSVAKGSAAALALWLLLGCGFVHAQPEGGDPELIALVENEYTSIDEFLGALEDLKGELVERGDARAPFAAAYVVLTRHAKETYESGAYEDAEWGANLTVAFGNLYRQAFYDYEVGDMDAVPLAWRVAFDAARRGNVTVFQHALLGVHAHINRDLAYAIATVTPFGERALRYHDYVVTNEFVVGAISEVEFVLGNEFAPPLAELDEALGDLDAELLRGLLTQWRIHAWRIAQFFDGRFPPLFESFFGWGLEMQTWRLARVIATGDRIPN